jgi:hypothetical protein
VAPCLDVIAEVRSSPPRHERRMAARPGPRMSRSSAAEDHDVTTASLHALVGAEYRVTLCDLQVLVDEAAEPISSEHADGRPGTWRDAACGRSLIQ